MAIFVHSDDLREFKPRLRWAFFIVSTFFLILLGRLWYLQVIRGQYFYDFSRQNSFKVVNIPASRGRVLDRNGIVLADNRPGFQALWYPQYFPDSARAKSVLAEMLEIPEPVIEESMLKQRGQPRYRPVRIFNNLAHEQLARLEVNRVFIPGIETMAVPQRDYPLSSATFHLLGYIGEINKDELQTLSGLNPELYKQGDIIGKSGIEQIMDFFLKGIDGGEQVAVDAHGRRTDDALFIRDLQDKKPAPGNDIYLTLDSRLQELAHHLFESKQYAGSAIVMDVKTGALLTLYSGPSLDPHMFARGITRQEWADIQTNVRKPLIDKSLSGQYPPGSTYKIVTAAAGLAFKKITPQEKISCPGFLYYGGRPYRCWKATGHGSMNMHDAIVQSCDVYFYKLGLRVGIDDLAKMAREFGFDQHTKVGLNNEQKGLIPSKEWKKKNRREEWQEGETLSCAIGQGYDLVTPIQLVRAMAAVVNGGDVFRPWVVQKAVDINGKVMKTFEGEVISRLELTPDLTRVIMDGLTDVVQSPLGTAHWTWLKDVPFGGKTGTAQVVRIPENKRVKSEDLAYLVRDHSWFVAFAPTDKPEIAVVVMVEHGGHGSTAAAPIARDLIQKYFELKKPRVILPPPPPSTSGSQATGVQNAKEAHEG